MMVCTPSAPLCSHRHTQTNTHAATQAQPTHPGPQPPQRRRQRRHAHAAPHQEQARVVFQRDRDPAVGPLNPQGRMVGGGGDPRGVAPVLGRWWVCVVVLASWAGSFSSYCHPPTPLTPNSAAYPRCSRACLSRRSASRRSRRVHVPSPADVWWYLESWGL